MKFTKMHGIGNDYIYVNCFKETVENPSELSVRLSDRHFGIGSDGLVLIKPSDTADFRMEIFNADGSEARMCGNAIRCIGKYVYERGMTDKETITVDTLSGKKILFLHVTNGIVESVKVNMGQPELNPQNIPVRFQTERVVDMPVDVNGEEVRITCVSMGNPHCITYVDDVNAVAIECIGPAMEHHPIFPDRANIEFVQVLSENEIKVRVWERGSGETWACGTGACASVVASAVNGKTARSVKVHLRGGDLNINWDEATGNVFMEGPAAFVFDGTVDE